MLALALLTLSVVGLDEPDLPPAKAWEAVATRKPTDVRLAPLRLGPGWEAGPIIAVDDLDDLRPLAEATREGLRPIVPQLRAEGVRRLKEYTFNKSTFPLDSLTVRVFVFDDPDRCRAWWMKKYRGEGWQKFYKIVPSDRFAIVDSTEMAKRAAAFGNVAVTSGHVGKGDEQIRALDAVIAALTEVDP